MATTRLLQSENMLFDPKQQSLPFTIGLIKPNTCLNIDSVQKILQQIEANGFQIRNLIQRELFKEEAMNLMYKHEKKQYFDELIAYLTSGQCCVFLLCHQTQNPITKWKKIIGPSDPEQAKKTDPTCLRSQYGTNITKNEFHGSDDPVQANKQRQIFEFKIPQKAPQYVETPYKITLDRIKKFLHPPNLEHTIINERLDIMALYGPVVGWHSIQVCFCRDCVKVARLRIEQIKKEKPKQIRNRPVKLLKQHDIDLIQGQLCEKCREHCSNFMHLTSGREGQHILTDAEINELAYEINKKQLLELLTVEKGGAAKIMIETLQIKEPKEIHYNLHFVQQLIKDLETDFYQRYDFKQLQNVILEDRRIRMTYWISKLTQKPVSRFPPVTSLDNSLTNQQLTDPKSAFFTLKRTKPLPLLIQVEEIKHTPLAFQKSILDKKRLHEPEQNIVIQKRIHRNLTKVSTVGQKHMGSKMAVTLLRDYNEGRHATWDNYSGLKGNSIKQPVGGRNLDKAMKQ